MPWCASGYNEVKVLHNPGWRRRVRWVSPWLWCRFWCCLLPGCGWTFQGFDQDARQRTARFAVRGDVYVTPQLVGIWIQRDDMIYNIHRVSPDDITEFLPGSKAQGGER